MASIEIYRTCIQNIIREYASHKTIYEDVDTETIFDTERDHYQLVRAGWHNRRRIYGCIMHFDIKDGKIWIQYNGTELDLANKLVEMGVPKEDIVLAFHPPYKRPYTEFAVN